MPVCACSTRHESEPIIKAAGEIGSMWFERVFGHLRVVLGREAADSAAVHDVDAEHPYKGAEVEQPTQRNATGVVPLVHSHLR